ncbi:MAG: C25 family cysteine peptidase [Candidatus Bathyarchaeota archaeon]|nr:C25 family cysteine peptidase [Candidatus Bathyarchaeota archaeon]
MRRIASGIIATLLLASILTFTSKVKLIEAESPWDNEINIDSSSVYEARTRPKSIVLNNDERHEDSYESHLKSKNSINVNARQGCIEETESVEKLLWHSPVGTNPTLFNETVVISKPFGIRLANRIEAPKIGGIYILVNNSIYGEVQSRLDQYVLDVLDAGYWVDVYTIQGGTPEDVRAFLQDGLSEGLVGCLFVGDVPEPWYEIYGCWDEYNEEFPIDLFYMDLNGLWTDSDGDGIYDEHSGDTAPEIWVGRLKASNIEGDEVSLINNYFEKNHLYRTGGRTVPQRALIYIDDDWTYMADSVNSSLSEVYSGVTDVIVDGSTTIAEDYKSRIAEGYEWLHLQCHGWSGGHSFKIGDEWTGGTVYSSDYRLIDPPVFFYQLFVCSGARYVEPDYLAGSCIFADEYGLLAIGSTKTGSMLSFSDFYGKLAEGDCIGKAFRRWLVEHGEGSPCWFYGLSIIGDPTLIPAQATHAPVEVKVVPETIELGPEMVVGKTFTVAVVVENVSDLAAFNIQFSWNTTYLEYVNHTATIPVEDFLDPIPPSPYAGILHDPPLRLKDEVNVTAGTYWAAFGTLGGPSFNGNGTVFVMTFRVVYQPLVGEEDVSLSLHLTGTDLARDPLAGGGTIAHDIFDGTVIIHASVVHDIGIVNVTTSKAGCLPLETVGQEYNMTVYVNVENQGNFTEIFNVTVYTNATTIGKQLVVLNPGYNITLEFTWDTTGFAKGNYSITTTADTVSGETDATDNTMIYPRYTFVTIAGDIDGDGDVDIYDIVRMTGVYGISKPDPRYDPNSDIDNDGDIDSYDIVAAANNYGESW